MELEYIPAMPLGPDNEPVWTPRADVLRNSAGEFTVKIELAALRREDIEINLEGRRLVIEGRRPDHDRETDRCHYLTNEICWGRFELAVEVPEGFDANRATAKYQNGLLKITVPPKCSSPPVQGNIPRSSL